MIELPPTCSDHPPTWKFDYPIYHPESRAQWRAWLQVNHDRERGMWLCSWKSTTGRPSCPYPEAVEEALCFGWIDSTVVTLDAERGLQLMTRRKAKSTWTGLNRRRVADMDAAGLMTNAGRQAVAVAQANGFWTILDTVESLTEPDDLLAALDVNPAARRNWSAFPASSRKQMLGWIVLAGKLETRAARVATIVNAASRGERAKG